MSRSGRLTILFSLILLAAGAVAAQVAIEKRAEAPNVFYVDTEKTAYLGVELEEETDHEEGGARITRVVEDSPAEEAGLEEGDIIVSFDGSPIRGPVGLTKKIHEQEPGDSVTISIVRDGKKKSIDVELGDRSTLWQGMAFGQYLTPEFNEQLREQLEKQKIHLEGLGDRLKVFGDCEEGDCGIGAYSVFFGKPKLGVQLVETTPELREHLGGSDDAGVLVSKVLEGTPAEAAGVRVGDLITLVDGDEVASSTDLRRALADKTGESFEIEVIRDGRAVRLDVTIPDPEDDPPTGPRAGLFVLPAPAPLAPPAPPLPPAVPAPPAPPKGPRSVV